MLRWSAAIRHSGVPARAFDVRAGTRRVGVRAVRRGPRPETLRLSLARAAAVTHVRYRGATKAVRGTGGRRPRAPRSRPPRAPARRRGSPTSSAAATAGAAEASQRGARERSQAPTSAEVPAAAEPAAPAPWSTLRPPILNAQHELMPFGARSFWLQPWRAYLDTVPGSVLRDAVGVNFNVGREDADRAARQLAAAGVRRARVEFGWDSMRYDDPAQLADPGKVDAILGALARNGIRPLLLLNAHHGAPGPVIHHPAAAGRAGPRRLPAASAWTLPRSCPGAPGSMRSTGPTRPRTCSSPPSAPDGTATLSKPLPRDLAAGIYPGATLRFAPFAPPRRADGSPNPAFEDTLAGWLQYAGAITRRAREVLGGDAFDVEIWNELSFGSDFLDAGRYYDPVPEALRGDGDVPRAILERTVAFLRDPRERRRGHRDRRRLRQRAAVAVRRHRARRGDRDRQAPVSAGARLSGGPPDTTRPRSGPTATRRPGRRGCARSSPSTGSAACRPRRWCATSRPPPRSCTGRRTAATPAPPAARRRSCG